MKLEFRAWNKEKKEWLLTKFGGQSLNYLTKKIEYTYRREFDLHEYETLRTIGAFSVVYDVSQYTGIKDKNNKKIFDGDILERPDYHRRLGHVLVEISNGYCEEDDYDFGGFSFAPYRANELIIVGNKFENPELWMGKK